MERYERAFDVIGWIGVLFLVPVGFYVFNYAPAVQFMQGKLGFFGRPVVLTLIAYALIALRIVFGGGNLTGVEHFHPHVALSVKARLPAHFRQLPGRHGPLARMWAGWCKRSSKAADAPRIASRPKAVAISTAWSRRSASKTARASRAVRLKKREAYKRVLKAQISAMPARTASQYKASGLPASFCRSARTPALIGSSAEKTRYRMKLGCGRRRRVRLRRPRVPVSVQDKDGQTGQSCNAEQRGG
jgi:hypothetical protein